MRPSEPSSSNSLRYFVLGVLCVAVMLGVYFVRLNAQVDRAREAANERLTLCRHVESVARSVQPDNPETRDTCVRLNRRLPNSVTPP